MRATCLQFRNPKELTPSGYYPLSTIEGRRLFNRCAELAESESRQGSFSRGTRFNSLGSIYKNVVDRTERVVGPGSYTLSNKIESSCSRRPCMASIHQPEVALAGTEAFFDLQGHSRILQTSYMPQSARNGFE